MRKLTITDVGPIFKTATIEFSRFCVLIGPQSNGKSTIAKVLSTCMWLEKEACTSLSTDIVKDGESFKIMVEDFHRMHNYIHPDSSFIEYQSPFVNIFYDKGDFSLTFNNNLSYVRQKISYMPSDRNVVTMKDIEKRDLEPNSFRSFLFDWLDTSRHFDSKHKAPILNLGMKYYFNDKTKDRKDMLTHENGVTYDIPLYDASSGMQSLVPMTVLMHYLTTDYFENFGKDVSFEQEQKRVNLAWAVTHEITKKYYPEEVKREDYKDVYSRLIKAKSVDADPTAVSQMIEMKKLFNNLSRPQSISFILEEPEQNLFPHTQLDLVSDVVSCCNGENHKSTALITTHSPYVLSAINILMFAGQLQEQGISPDVFSEFVSVKSVISPKEVEVYAVKGGICYSIKDPSTGLINQNELDTASDYNAALFDKLYSLYISKLQQS